MEDKILKKIQNDLKSTKNPVVINNNDKIVHIATERMSLYDLYINKGIQVDPITMDEQILQVLPKDTSLINNSI